MMDTECATMDGLVPASPAQLNSGILCYSGVNYDDHSTAAARCMGGGMDGDDDGTQFNCVGGNAIVP